MKMTLREPLVRPLRWEGRMTEPLIHARLCVLRQRIPLTQHELANWLWQRLRDMFPDVLAAVLMPDHLHLLLRALAERVRERLRDLVRALRRRDDESAEILWLPIEMPTLVVNTKHASRQTRYLHLNPSRDGLVDDPLSWPWSTHRDAIGAVADPWVTPERLARALGRALHRFEGWLHQYVSADPTVAVAGTPCPVEAPASIVTTFPLLDIMRAAASATRARPTDVGKPGPTRDLFLRLAARDGWHDNSRLAAVCSMTPHGVRKNLRRIDVPGINAAALCLGDPRLRITTCPPLPPPSYARRDWPAASPTTAPSRLRAT